MGAEEFIGKSDRNSGRPKKIELSFEFPVWKLIFQADVRV